MAVSLPLFDRFPAEGFLVGRILSAYGELEFEFCRCVAIILKNQDMAVKAMFRARGETQRIDVGDALGRQGFHAINLGTQFEEAVSGIRYSLKIRNQYAHCLWSEPEIGKMAFVNLEEIASPNAMVDFSDLTQHRVDHELLRDQMAYLSFVEDCFIYLGYEARVRTGTSVNHLPVPKKVARPVQYFP